MMVNYVHVSTEESANLAIMDVPDTSAVRSLTELSM